MLRRGLAVLILSVVSGVFAAAAERADAIDGTVARYFRPYEIDAATLSPDGRHVAMAQYVRGGDCAVAVIDLTDRSSKRYVVGSSEHAVQQLQWISATRVVFTTQSRGVGVVDVERREIKPLLVSHQVDRYHPQPMIGLRYYDVMRSAELPADPGFGWHHRSSMRRQVTLPTRHGQAHVSGDMFGSESTLDTGRVQRPFLLGAAKGSSTRVLVEVRIETDVIGAGVRGTAVVADSAPYLDHWASSAADFPDFRSGDPWRNGNTSYDVIHLTPPLVVLEIDTTTGRVKEIEEREDWRRVWLDHAGEVRVALEQSGSEFKYLYRRPDTKRWVPLDGMVPRESPLGFSARADSLLAPRSVPLGFSLDGRLLFIATNVGRDTYGLRALDTTNGRLTDLEVGHERFDLVEPTALAGPEVLRFDRFTNRLAGVQFAAARRQVHWLDGELAALQRRLNQLLAPQRCELREWNADRTRVLVEVSAPDDPGGFVVVETASGKAIRCGDRAPWLKAELRHPTHEFDFRGGDGRRFTGLLTLPRDPRLDPPPVLVYFHDGPWFSEAPVFNRGAQSLAALGFAVLQINHRGSSGLGRRHLTALDGGLDRVVLEDVQAVLARMKSGPRAVNTRLVATFGNGIGGYLAVRMAQLAPDSFRCAVAINAPGDLGDWRSHPDVVATLQAELRRHHFGKDREALRAQSALAAGPTTKVPVLVVHGASNTHVPPSLGRDLYRALKKGSDETEYLELPGTGHGGWSEQTTARLFAELGRFFNATVYNYRVKMSAPQVVPADRPETSRRTRDQGPALAPGQEDNKRHEEN